MSKHVVDASVVLKWYFHEPFSDVAVKLVVPGVEIFVPDLLHGQVGNALWRRVKSGEMKRDEAHKVLSNLRRLPLVTVPSADLAPAALEIATATARTFNESVYFALALREGVPLVTADRWWFTLLSTGPMRRFLQWVGDVPEPTPSPAA